jgi:hypothetical protein
VRRVGPKWASTRVDSWELWDAVGEPEACEATYMTRMARRVSELVRAAWYADDAEAEGFDATAIIADSQTAQVLLGVPECSQMARHAVVQRYGGVGALMVIACEEAVADSSPPGSGNPHRASKGNSRAREKGSDRSAGSDGSAGSDRSAGWDSTVGYDRSPGYDRSAGSDSTIGYDRSPGSDRSKESDNSSGELVPRASKERLAVLLRDFCRMGPRDLDALLAEISLADGGSPAGEVERDRRWLNVTYAIAARDGTAEAHHAYVEALDRVLASTRALIAS